MKFKIKRVLTVAERKRLEGFSPLVAHLLFHRGITDANSAKKYLEPNYDDGTHDPFLFKDAEKAAGRIIKAIQNNEKIAIYADYDADGIPGAAIFHDFFKKIGFSNFMTYIPHRHDEGFGVNQEAVRELVGNGVNLLITVDCGITDIVPISLAKKLGLDVIITDHHEPPAQLPEAFAIVDHKQIGCEYPDKNICGAGTAYKLIQAVLKKNRFGLKEGQEKWFLDMVGIATLSDMVPLTGENRVFARYGLTVLRKSPRKGLMCLLNKLKIPQKHITEDDIAFMITPRINAASRMGVPMDAFRLLTAENDNDAYIYVEHLDKINNERKGVVASLVKEVKKTVHERHGTNIPSVIVLGNPAWRPALLGLAANSCAEEFKRPVFLWGRDGDDVIKGSCRSGGASNVVELMRAVPGKVFSQFGGHRHSGGFAVFNESIHYLEQRLNEAAEKIEVKKNRQTSETDREANPDLDSGMVDTELSLDDIGHNLFNDINRLSPFGVGNAKPVFLFRDVVIRDIRTFGKANEHIELTFHKTNGTKVSAVSFFGVANDWANVIKPSQSVDLAASIERSMFRGRSEIRLRIIDVC